FYQVSFWNLEIRIGDDFSKARIVGEQQQPAGILIEPAHRNDPLAGVLNEVVYRGASMRVLVSGDVALRLVQQKVDSFRGSDRLAVQRNGIALEIHPVIRCLNQFAVYLDALGSDPLAGVSTRAEASFGKHALQSLERSFACFRCRHTTNPCSLAPLRQSAP